MGGETGLYGILTQFLGKGEIAISRCRRLVGNVFAFLLGSGFSKSPLSVFRSDFTTSPMDVLLTAAGALKVPHHGV